ncbi:MAG: MFS transporter [Haloarculaceae archaeon]
MSDPRDRLSFSVWWLVVAGAVVMAVAGSYQFLWSSIRDPLGAHLGVSETALGTVFTAVIVSHTAAQLPFGWVRDHYGPRWPLLAGGLCLGTGFAVAALTTDLALVILGFCIGGVGSGAGYTVAVNTPVKWLDSRRGLATGVISMAYSAGSFLAIPLVRRGVRGQFRATMLGLAVVAAVGVLVTVPVLRDPGDGTRSVADGGADTTPGPPAEDPGNARAGTGDERAYTWRETLRTWQFWVLYGAFTLANAVSLLVVGKAVSYAGHLGLSAAVATGGATLIALGDAIGIIAGGAVSDRLGRERTVGLSLICFGLAVALAVGAGSRGFDAGFVALLALAILFRSPMFSVLPPLMGEYYGRSHASTNYALLYSGKVWGGVGAGVLASLLVTTVGWNLTFLGGGVLAVVAGVATLFVRPVDPAA